VRQLLKKETNQSRSRDKQAKRPANVFRMDIGYMIHLPFKYSVCARSRARGPGTRPARVEGAYVGLI
jgi:hypothetical protein